MICKKINLTLYVYQRSIVQKKIDQLPLYIRSLVFFW